jgi:hypothetical protein
MHVKKKPLGNRISKLMRKGWEVKCMGDGTRPPAVCDSQIDFVVTHQQRKLKVHPDRTAQFGAHR